MSFLCFVLFRLLLRDRLGPNFHDAAFCDLFPALGRPVYAPRRLALSTLVQLREGLSDQQAIEVLRARIDRKYLLALDLAYPGFHHRVLCGPSACAGPATAAWTTGLHGVAMSLSNILDCLAASLPGQPVTPTRMSLYAALTTSH